VEGESLRWDLRLSTPTTGVLVLFYYIQPNGTELSTSDVPPSWLDSVGLWGPSSHLPLSSLGSILYVSFPYGITNATVLVPITTDRKSESDEMIILQTFDYVTNITKPLTLVGRVPRSD